MLAIVNFLITFFKVYLTFVHCTTKLMIVANDLSLDLFSIVHLSVTHSWFSLFADLPRVNVFMDTTSTVLVKGTSVLLSCNATSHPVPVVSWTKDNNWYVCVCVCVCVS